MGSLTTNEVRSAIAESIGVKQRLMDDERVLELIVRTAQACVDAFRRGNKLMLAGNGGSAADAQHIATEFVSRFSFERPGLPAIALTTDSSLLTAIGNDYGSDELFRRQVEANGNKGDVLIGISTSGNSRNVINALGRARELGIFTVGLGGATGGNMPDVCDICIKVPSLSTPRIQETHITVGHIICGIVEAALFGQDAKK